MKELKCKWYRKFDGHYTMDCTNDNGQRANGEFKRYPYNKFDNGHNITKWEFTYCPYCGKEIEIVKMDMG